MSELTERLRRAAEIASDACLEWHSGGEVIGVRTWDDLAEAADRIEGLEHSRTAERLASFAIVKKVADERDAERALADRLAEALRGSSDWLPAAASGSPLDRSIDAALDAYRAARNGGDR